MPPIVLREIERAVGRPSRQEVLRAIREQPEVALYRSPAACSATDVGFARRASSPGPDVAV